MSEILIAKIQLLFYICKENNIRLHARDGFLLGIIRHGGFMKYDIDPDIFIHGKELIDISKIGELSNGLFTFNMHPTLNDVFYIYSNDLMIGEGVCLIEESDNYLYEGNKLYGGLDEEHLFYEYYGHSKDETRYRYEESDIYPLESVLFYGKDILVPKNSLKVLINHYGSDVMTHYLDKTLGRPFIKKEINDEIKLEINQEIVDREYIYNKMLVYSGPHIDHLGNNNSLRDGKPIYSSFHFPTFTYTDSLRNTLVSFEEFNIEDLTGKNVLDIGSNIGGIAFECLNRGAKSITGIEYNKNRVNICKDLAKYLKIDDKCSFNCADMNEILSDNKKISIFRSNYSSDVVICKAVDAYINEKAKLYDLVADVTGEICYFETNSGISDEDFCNYMSKYFNKITKLGTTKSDDGYGRLSYILDKRVLMNKDKKLGSILNNRCYKVGGGYITEYDSLEYFGIIKEKLELLGDCSFIPKIEYRSNGYKIRELRGRLDLIKDSLKYHEKLNIKNQIIDIIKYMNRKGIAHRDFHIRNLYYDNYTLYLLDYEYLTDNKVELVDSYDLTGVGLESPLESDHMNIFTNHSISVKSLLYPIPITIEDFIA